MTTENPSSAPKWPIGWTVRHVAETGSTNDDLVAEARQGAADRTVIVADFQSAGKGRLDRTWESRRGANLLVSLLFRHADEDPARYPRIVALSARAACRRLFGVEPSLKWPNDLLIDGRKLGGLLAVAVPEERVVVVGIGVNVGWAPDGAVALREASDPGAAAGATPLALLAAMLTEIDARRDDADDALRLEHLAALETIGCRVRVEIRDGATIVGLAVDVDEASRLVVVDDSGARRVVDVGDVVHLRR